MMNDSLEKSEIVTRCTAFADARRVGSGELQEVAVVVKAVLDADPEAVVLIFDDVTSDVIEVDFRGTADDVRARLARAGGMSAPRAVPAPTAQGASAGPGRPKLGVVGREVTLLPRHWDWLNRQPGGASVALRKLVEAARRDSRGRDRVRQSQEASYRFLSVMAGDRPGFEEATRALFAGDRARFDALVEAWPVDIRDHARTLTDVVFTDPPGGSPA